MISFVIPALNEEKYIANTIAAIHASCRGLIDYEIVLSDHGSSDGTRDIAESLGAKIITPEARTIGALRNRGVSAALGEVLVFIDADVTLTSEWRRHILEFVESLRSNPFQIGGSKCIPPDNGEFLMCFWYGKLSQEQKPTHIGTPHMIVHRELFQNVGGFDESLVTGEDYDFCMRAKLAGAVLATDDRLGAIHNRLPKTLREFLLRERWHGLSDFRSIRSVVRSKVALMTLVFLALHLALIISLLYFSAFVSLSIVIAVGLHLFLSARTKFFRLSLGETAKAMCVFYFYYLGRGLSLMPRRKRRWMQPA